MGSNYCVLELELAEDIDEFDFELNDSLDELEAQLQTDGYDYYLTSDPYANQIVVLIIPDKYLNGTYSGLDELLSECGFTYTVK